MSMAIFCCHLVCRRVEADGFWSQEGVTTEVTFYDEKKRTYDVICTSDHLTSFAVMLDVNMALSVSSYTYRSGGSRGVSTISIETPFELAKRLTVSLQLEQQQPLSLHLCACATKGGIVATVHMHMKFPFPNPGSATVSVDLFRGSAYATTQV